MRLFGTDGIRGVANRFPMSVEVALKVGKALTYLLSKRGKTPPNSDRKGHKAFRLHV